MCSNKRKTAPSGLAVRMYSSYQYVSCYLVSNLALTRSAFFQLISDLDLHFFWSIQWSTVPSKMTECLGYIAKQGKDVSYSKWQRTTCSPLLEGVRLMVTEVLYKHDMSPISWTQSWCNAIICLFCSIVSKAHNMCLMRQEQRRCSLSPAEGIQKA